MATRKGGLGRRLSDITAELDLQYPAYEGLFSKTPERPAPPAPPPVYYLEEDDEEKRPSFTDVLTDLGLSDSLFDVHLVAHSEGEGAGPSASTRVAAYLFSLPEGQDETKAQVIYSYLKLKEEGKENTFKNRFEANLYVKWQKYAKGATAYVTAYEDITLKTFVEFSKASSLGRAINDLTSTGVSYKKTEDSAAALLI